MRENGFLSYRRKVRPASGRPNNKKNRGENEQTKKKNK